VRILAEKESVSVECNLMVKKKAFEEKEDMVIYNVKGKGSYGGAKVRKGK